MATPTKDKIELEDGFYSSAQIQSERINVLQCYCNLRKSNHLGVEVKDGVAKLVLADAPKVEEEPKAPEKSVALEAPPSTGEFVGLKDGKKIDKVEVLPVKQFSDGMPMIPSDAVLAEYTLKELKAFLRSTLGFEQKHLFRMRRTSCENLVAWSRKHLMDYWLWKGIATDD